MGAPGRPGAAGGVVWAVRLGVGSQVGVRAVSLGCGRLWLGVPWNRSQAEPVKFGSFPSAKLCGRPLLLAVGGQGALGEPVATGTGAGAGGFPGACGPELCYAREARPGSVAGSRQGALALIRGVWAGGSPGQTLLRAPGPAQHGSKVYQTLPWVQARPESRLCGPRQRRTPAPRRPPCCSQAWEGGPVF